MNTFTHAKSVAAKLFMSRANTLSVKQSAKSNLLLSIWQAVFGKSKGHALPKIAGLFLVGILTIQQSSAQQLVDNFDRSNSNTVGGGWSEDENSSSYCVISGNRLQIGGNNDDADFIYRDASSLFNTNYSTNTALMTWQFNMRQNDGTPGGFDGNSAGGMAYVLGCNNSSFTTNSGQGYAVVFGSSSSTDVMRLVRFSGGVDAEGNFTNIISGTTDYDDEYFAVRVTYNPATTQWSLYLNVNTSTFNDPNTASYSLVGQANNSTYTSQSLDYTGCFYKHGSSSDRALFDNVWVPTSGPEIITQPAATVNGCDGSSVTFTANANFDTGRQWEKFISGVWTAIGGATNDSYTINPASPADAGDYRVVYTNAVGTATSSVSTLVVGTPSVGGTVDFSMTVCSGQNNSTLNLSGHSGSVTRWELSTNGGGSWSNISNTTTSHPYSNITQTTHYRAVVTNGGCPSSNSVPAIITVVEPALFSVTGGGNFCAGGGANVGLSGSESGVDYQLMLNGSPVGSPLPGTGSALSFGLQPTTGNYTVIAVHNLYLCVRTMTGSANLVSLPLPTATANASNNLICGTGTTTLTSTGASNTTVLQNFASGTLNMALASNTSITDTITVYDAPTTMAAVTGFSVTVNITHSYDSDVEIYLVRPGGILNAVANGNYTQSISSGGSVCLSADAGGSGNNYTSTVFSSLGTQTCVANGNAPFTGTFLPENAFSTLTGDPNGVWTLKVVDDEAQDVGTLLNWTITMNTLSGVTYTWTSSPAGYSSSLQDPGTITPTLSREYIVTVTDNGSGCTATASTGVVNVSPTLTASCNVVTDATCFGANDGSINVTAVGGLTPYTGTGLVTGLSDGTYTYTVTDDVGCTSTCSSTIVVADNDDPIISGCPTSFSVNSTPGDCGAIVTWIEPTVTDNCSIDFFSSNYYVGDLFSIGLNSVTYIAQDPSGNQALCFFDVDVLDVEDPVITCPADITVSNSSGLCEAVVTFNASATDNCNATLSYAPASGSAFPVGTTTVTATATDDYGNTDVCTFTVTVTDTEFPTYTGCPSNITINTSGSCDQVVSWTAPTASDNCLGVASSSSHNPGDLFPVGTTIVTYTAIDAVGNTTICTFDVIVEDNEDPVITCPADITVTANSAGCAAVATFSATVTDNCSATLSYSPVSGSVFSGTTPVTVTATDPSGNISTCTFNVIVVNDLVASSSATTILCNGGSATVTVSAVGGTAPYTGEGTFTVTAGTHNYTVTDANGCTSSTSITVTEPAALVASSSATAILCNGGSATVTVSAVGGTAPYTGEGTFTVTAGTHNYTVTDANGCTSSTSITVTEPAALVASSSATDILCNGGSATVTVSAVGGTAPYTGDGTFTVTAGTYNYTVTDANGCSSSTSITLTEPSAVVVTATQGTDILCNGGTTTVTVSAVGGTTPYTGEGTFTVGAGTHNYTVTDANGCTSSTSITVTEPAALVASSSATAILCNGGSATVTVSAVGGTAPYTGEGTFTVTAGTHNYTVTDANGCTSSTSITVTEPAALVASSSATAILCNGGSATVTVSAVGGTAPYTGDGTFTVTAGTHNYTVTDANGCSSSTSITVTEPAALVASSSQGAAILCNGGTTTVTVSAIGGTIPYSGEGTFTVGAGTHNYTVTDANGCTSSTSITVTEPSAVVVTATQGAAILCNGGTTTVTVSAVGGTAPYTGEGTFTVGAGTHNYVVTDDNGCSGNTSITVTEPAALVASSSATAILCNGGSATVTVSAVGGTAPYTGDGAFTVAAGTHNYTVTDANGCSSSTSITVTEPAALVASSSATDILCNGGSATVTVSAVGGTTPYTGDGTFTVGAGTHNYTVTDANGCSSSTSITLTEPSAVVVTATQGADILCNGGTTTVTVSAVGGTTPYTGEGTFTVGAGTHNYVVTDDNGCTGNTSITVTEPAALVASSSATAILCNGGSATVTVSAVGGTAPYTGEGTFTVTAGTHNYTVTDANGCTSSTSITVTEPAALVASSSATDILCNGGTATVTVSAVGGTTPYTGEGTFTVTAGTHNYTVTDANGCTSSTSITVTEPAALVASSSQGAAILCNGGTTTVTVSAVGGTTPYTGDGTFTVGAGTHNYTVTDANGCTSSTSITVTEPAALVASSSATAILCNGGSATVTVSAVGGTAPYTGEGTFSVTAGTHNYTVTDANGCSSSTSIIVTEPAALVASSSATAILCNGGSATVTVSAVGGTAPYTGEGTFTVSAGTHNYTVTDANGCTSSTSITVTEPAALVASSLQGAAILCNGGTTTVTVSAVGGTTPYTGDGTFTVGAGTHNYTVTDANGCSSSTSITVTEPSAVAVTATQGADILCNGGTTTVTVSAVGGTAPYTGEGTFTVGAGTHNYVVTDDNGCSGNTSITVTEPAALVASSSATAILCNGGSATVTVSAVGGTVPYTGDGTFTVTAGTHNYTVTDANGCTSSTSVTVTEPAALVASSSATAILCNGGSATVTVSAVGGTAPYTGDGTFTVTAGTHSYTVTDANGCTSSTSVTVTEPAALVASSSQGAAILCNGGTTTVTVSAVGGTAPYTGEGTFTVGAGTHNYTVSDANGCTSSTSITVTEPAALVASSSATAILCNGGSATVTVSAVGGTAPYTGDGTFTVGAGTHNYTVTDANGCTSSTSVTVTEPAALVASSSATAILCNGGSATVTVSAVGGTAPYTGEGTFSVTAGTHNYTVTDANGCSSSTSVTVTEPAALVASSSQGAAILCNGGTTTVTVSAVDGTAPYTGEGTFTVGAGTHNYTVTDANGCTSSTSITVTEPAVLVASSSATAILCNGGTSTVTVSAVGGTTPYTGDGSFTVSAGTHNYTVTDANGCTSSTSITVTEPSVLAATATSTDASCLTCADGTATVSSITGGTAPYTVTPTSPATGLLTGNFCFTITDANGCSTTACTMVGYIACNITASVTETSPILCNGGTATVVVSAIGGAAPITGEGTFTVLAGTHTYTVTDVNGCPASASITITEPSALVATSTQGAAILCNGGTTTITVAASGGTAPYTGEGTFTVGAGTHNYTVTDANGCSSSTSITVTEPAALVASSTATDILCNGGSATVTVSAVGGTTPYTGDGTFTVTAGTHNYTVTDANGCTSSTSITVTEPAALVASSSATAILCNGGTSTVTVSAVGGTAPYTGEGTFTVGAGTHNYTVTDANGCSSSTSITVTEPAALVASSSATAILCNGGTATVTVSAVGGTAPYTGEGTFTVGAGTHNYTVTDANGCSSSTSITVTEPAALVASSTATDILCNGGSATVTVSATGGTAPYTGEGTFTVTAGTHNYTVTDANGCTSSTSITATEPAALVASSSATAILCNGGTSTVTVSAVGGTAPYTGEGTFTVGAGTHNYTVTDANGCSSSTSITVTEPAALVASSSATDILCNGGTATVTVSATGGTAPYTGEGTFTVGAGTHNYTVTDANGCTSSTSITVTEPAALVASSSATAILCNGGTATVTVSATGGTAPYTGEGTFTVAAGTHNYTVTDANGCTSSTSITVTEPAALVASSSATAILCNGGSATVTVSATGGTAPYTGEGTFTVGAGTHNYTVTDANGCSSSTSITLTEPAALVASSSATDILCNGGTATVTVSAVGGTAPYTGEGTFTVGAGTHNYTVTDANGCSSSTSITVTEPAALVASSSATAILCNGGSATVTVSAVGGTAPYTGEGTFTVTAGTHNYTVTDANGCTSSTSITVTEPAALVASSSATAILCNGGSSTVTVSAAGGTAPYTGEGTFTVTAGTHNYTVTDANGCTSSTSVTVTEPAALVASSSATAILCNGGTSTVTVSAVGGTAPYTGEGTFTVGAGTHNYTVTDANGCSSSTSITLTEPAALVASSSATAILCNGGSATVTVSAVGGTAPYTGDGTFTVTAGTHNYTVTDANGCTSSTSITVTEPSVLVASSSASTIDCIGGTTDVTVSATGGTAPYTGTGLFNELAGTYTYTVTDANGCSATTTITVIELDSQNPTIVGCPADITINTSGSCTQSVNWITPTANDNCSATLSSTHNSGDVFPIGTTTVTYTAIDPSGNTATCTFDVTVEDHENPVVTCPADIAVNNDAGDCGAIVNYTASVTDNCSATLSYSHASGSTFPIGTTTVTVTGTDASGNTSSCTFNVVVTDTEFPLIAGCPADIITCSPVVTWTAPTATDNCLVTILPDINPGSTFSAGTTLVTYSAVDASGNTTICTFNVTVNIPSTDPTSITSTTGASLCNGTSTTLSVVGGSLGTGAQWVWYSGSCGGTPAGTGPSITVTPGATTDYFVRAEGLCGNSACASMTITVYTGAPAGVVNTINGAISVCPGSSGVYSVNAVPNAGSYVWSAPVGTLINGLPSPVTTSTNSATLTFGTLPIGQSGYNICVFASNDCGSTAAKCAWIRGDLSTPNFFSAPTVICAGTTVTYQVSPLAGASNYIWTATGGATITGTGTSVQVTFPANYTTGTVCVAGQSPCGLTSAQRCVNVSSSPGLPGVITGLVKVCPGATETYSIAAVTGATSYIWTAPAGASISGPSNGLSVSIVFTAGFVSGQVTVKSVNSCGAQSAVRAKSVSTGKLPTPGNIVGDPTSGVCGQTYQYSISSLANATLGYVWTIPAGVTVIGPATSNSITLQFPSNFVSGVLSVAGNNGCGLGYARSINVYGNPATPGTITGNSSVCAGSVEMYSWAPVPGTSYYQIQAPVGSTILSGNITTNTFVLIQWGPTGGNIGVKAINNCGVSGTRTLNASIACRTAAEEILTDKLVVEAYPNPNHGKFSVSVDSKTDATYTLRILDQTGRILKTSIMNASEGINIQEFELEGIAAGIYILRLETESREVINRSIIIQ
jgi:subtilisin-like proprotein convertase family protein